jgi:hypothetical protein
MQRNDVSKFAVYVVSPLDVIPIRRIPQPGKEREFQMIMRIHEARQKQEPVEVYRFEFQ